MYKTLLQKFTAPHKIVPPHHPIFVPECVYIYIYTLISEWFEVAQNFEHELVAAMNTGDLELIISLFCEDTVLMAPNDKNYYGIKGKTLLLF